MSVYFMPTRIIMGDDAVASNPDKLILGKRAFIVTGKSSGRLCGALDDVTRVLDALKKNSVQGAFFILNNLVESSPELVKRMDNDGHLVCNHTGTHKDMSKVVDYKDFFEEISTLESIYTSTTGKSISKFFRPPEGKFSMKTLEFAKRMGYKTIFWSFAYADWDNNNQMSEEQAIKKIMDNIHNGAVLLLHPTSETNAKILDKVIKEIKSQGYRFGTLDELTRNA